MAFYRGYPNSQDRFYWWIYSIDGTIKDADSSPQVVEASGYPYRDFDQGRGVTSYLPDMESQLDDVWQNTLGNTGSFQFSLNSLDLVEGNYQITLQLDLSGGTPADFEFRDKLLGFTSLTSSTSGTLVASDPIQNGVWIPNVVASDKRRYPYKKVFMPQSANQRFGYGKTADKTDPDNFLYINFSEPTDRRYFRYQYLSRNSASEGRKMLETANAKPLLCVHEEGLVESMSVSGRPIEILSLNSNTLAESSAHVNGASGPLYTFEFNCDVLANSNYDH